MVDADLFELARYGWIQGVVGDIIPGKRFQMESDPAAVTRSGRRVPLGFRLEVRYATAMIGSQEFLLPQFAAESALYYKTWTKVEIQFQQYRKYDAHSTIKFDVGKD